MNAAIAISSAKKSYGESNIKPPGSRPGVEGLTAFEKSSAPSANAQAWRGPLLQHLAAEAEQRGGTSAGLCRHHPGRVDQGPGFHQPAEILLVQVPPRDRLPAPPHLTHTLLTPP